jgi:predicted dithiol-disulfide oxidoreductase (DUF899 family)
MHTEIVTPQEWQAARDDLLVKEKEATRARDALAAERRRLPVVEYRADYVFAGADGEATLLDLFEGRRQLIVYHFMFQEGIEGYPDAGCSGCTMFVDQVGHLAHFHARDTSFALVSRGPAEKLQAYRARMGWDVPWYSTAGNSFNDDCGIRGGFGLSVFSREGDRVFRSYFTSGRGVEALGSVWTFLDLTPLGRQEEWEEGGDPAAKTPPYEWWRRHDEY